MVQRCPQLNKERGTSTMVDTLKKQKCTCRIHIVKCRIPRIKMKFKPQERNKSDSYKGTIYDGGHFIGADRLEKQGEVFKQESSPLTNPL